METKKTTISSSKENVITLRDIVELFLNNWYWFVVSAVACVAMAWVYLSATPPLYQRTAVMLVKGDSQNSQNDISAMWEVSGGLGGSGVENEVYILRSYQILNDVVQRLHLDVDYTIRDGLRRDNLFGDLPFEVRFLDIYPGFTELTVSIINEKGVRISQLEIDGNAPSYEQVVAFNDTLSTPAGRILVLPHAESIPHYQGKEIRVTRSDLESATNAVMARIQTSALASQSTLVNIICQDVNIARADAILTSILQVYNETIVEDKNRIASNTARFIDERIVIISRELGDVENKLTTFKQEHRIVDINSNANLYLQEGSKAKEESIQLEAQLNVVEFVKNYVTDKTRSSDLIPNVSGVGDVGVQSQIESYNEMMLQRNRLVTNSGENNPVVQNMNRNLDAMRKTIAGSIDNYVRTIRLRLQNARKVENKVNQNIENIPQQEKYALDVMRQQSIKETLYTYLLQKREETAMQLAVTEANIRVVEAPFINIAMARDG
ncbi:GumC family protein, partial [Phocaeicola sartorii]|uniref:GumC family protein n=1 Tax=Phocaeicola sartorii TaxID=671267 RepID=UPI0026EC2882